MINVFEDINEGNFIKLSKAKELMPNFEQDPQDLVSGDTSQAKFLHGQVVNLQKLPKVSAKITDGDIKLKHISVITPSGDVVVPDLSLQVRSYL